MAANGQCEHWPPFLPQVIPWHWRVQALMRFERARMLSASTPRENSMAV